MSTSSNPSLPKNQLILIVEDSHDDYEATKRAFSKTNLRNQIHRAESGESALAFLQAENAQKPGIILLDLNMPGLDGRKTLEIIKKNEEQYKKWPASRKVFLPKGRPPETGEVFKQPDLARTMQYMADQEKKAARKGRKAGLKAARDAFY